MVNPLEKQYQSLKHIGPGNIESFTGKILNNVKTALEEGLISNKFIFHAGDVIYGKINPQLGKYCVPSYDGLASADAYVLSSSNESVLNKKFIYYIIQTLRFYRYSVSVSMRTGMPKINRNELDLYRFDVPSVYEQKKISNLLDYIEELIASNQRNQNSIRNKSPSYIC